MCNISVLFSVFVLCNVLCGLQAATVASRLIAEKTAHKALKLSDENVIQLANLSDLKHFENVLDTILVPRVVGTQNHELVKQFIIDSMQQLGWTVETDPFEENTPIFGRLKFENIVATLNPNAERYMVLACHYDSKYFREHNFVGATDSAVPCAMMINLAYVLDQHLKRSVQQNDVSLRFIFFDGEEAFREWGPRDSIYGSRHLAAKWEQTSYPKNNADGTNELHRMDALVLLDLLGAPDPAFYNFFPETEKWYRQMARVEDRLAKLGQLVQYSVGKPEQRYFKRLSQHGGIEDDHIPFKIRGVPILHLIPLPFPREWHTEADNRNAVDLWTVENLNKILRVFLAQYLHLQV